MKIYTTTTTTTTEQIKSMDLGASNSCERNGTRCVRLSRARALSLSLDPTSKNKRKKTNTIIKNAVRVRTRHALVTMLTCACVRYKRVASTFLRMLD